AFIVEGEAAERAGGGRIVDEGDQRRGELGVERDAPGDRGPAGGGGGGGPTGGRIGKGGGWARGQGGGAVGGLRACGGGGREGGIAGDGDVGCCERLIVEPAGPGALGFAHDGAGTVPGGAGGGLADAHETLLEIAARRDGPHDGVVDVDQGGGVDDPARRAGL